MRRSTKTGNTEVGESVWSKETAELLRWGINGRKNEWVIGTIHTGNRPPLRMWRSIPHWIYKRDGMGYRGAKEVLIKT